MPGLRRDASDMKRSIVGRRCLSGWLAWLRCLDAWKALSEDAAIRACKNVTLRASMLMDADDCDALIALCTSGFEFVRPSTFPDVSIKGAEALRVAMRARPAGFVSRHICTNQIVELSGETVATVRSYFTHYSALRTTSANGAVPIAEALRSVGEYEDVVVRTAQGWRIARRTGRFIFGGV